LVLSRGLDGSAATRRRQSRKEDAVMHQAYFRLTFCSTGPALTRVHSTMEPS
jgi:hypothetical protein